jgi:hypothetical protein
MYRHIEKYNIRLLQNLNIISCKKCHSDNNKLVNCDVFNLVTGFKYHGIASCSNHSKAIQEEIKEFENKYCIYDLSNINTQYLNLNVNLLDGTIIESCSLQKITGYDGNGTTFLYDNQLMIFVGKEIDYFSNMYVVKLSNFFKDNNIDYKLLNLPEQIIKYL